MDSPKNLTFVSDPVSCEFQGSNILLIPEVGLAHLGNLQLALNYIDFLAGIGLPIIKFQHHFSIFESSPTEPFRVSHDHFPMSRHNYWEYTDFSDSDWKYIYSYAHQKGIAFAITPNSRQSAEYVNRYLKPAFWKVGSSDITNYHLIDFLVDTDIPIIVSTGLANQESLNSLNESYGFSRFIFLSCHSSYPTPLSSFSLERLTFLSAAVNSPNVGLSDHSGVISPILLAFSKGYRIFEFHFSISEYIYNFDASSSLTPDKLSSLLLHLNDFYSAMVDPFESGIKVTNSSVHTIFSKVICASRDLVAGDVLDSSNLCMIRGISQSSSISMSKYHHCLGRVLINPISRFSPLTYSDFK